VSVCLDPWAILAWLDGEEPALARVNAVLDSRPLVSWINLVEVHDRVERDHGRDRADDTLATLRSCLSPDLPGTARMIDAARLKARAPIAKISACHSSSPSRVATTRTTSPRVPSSN